MGCISISIKVRRQWTIKWRTGILARGTVEHFLLAFCEILGHIFIEKNYFIWKYICYNTYTINTLIWKHLTVFIFKIKTVIKLLKIQIKWLHCKTKGFVLFANQLRRLHGVHGHVTYFSHHIRSMSFIYLNDVMIVIAVNSIPLPLAIANSLGWVMNCGLIEYCSNMSNSKQRDV